MIRHEALEVPSRGALRVMIVEDHALVRQTLCDRLAGEADMEVVASASNGPQAMCKLLLHKPDVVLLDVDLEGLTSIGLMPRLRSLHPPVKIVFLSGMALDAHVSQAVQAGCDGFVSKREPLEVLLTAVRAVAGGQQVLSPAIEERLVSSKRGGPRTRTTCLTDRQREVLSFIAVGFSKQQIADKLQISVKTVGNHCEALMKRLDLHDRVDLTRLAIREGLVQA